MIQSIMTNVLLGFLFHSVIAQSGEMLMPLSDRYGAWAYLSNYSDEFNSNTLDLDKWDNDIESWGTWSWSPENVSVGSGRLVLSMQYQEHVRSGHKLLYKSGVIRSKSEPILYGYFEARIKASSKFPGVSPAFWAYRKEQELWTELDFVELTQRWKTPKQIDINTLVHRHPDLKDKLVEERTLYVDWDPRDDYHVYGCDWSKQEIRWYIDGQLVGTRKNDYWHQSLDVLLSFGEKRSLREHPTANGFPATYSVDYVRVWKH